MISSDALKNHVAVAVQIESASVSAPNEPANFLLTLNKQDIANYSRVGNDLTIELRDGRTLRIEGFFRLGATANNLILLDGDGRSLVDFQAALSGADGISEPAVLYETVDEGNATDALWAWLGAAGIGLLASSAGGGGGDALPIVPPVSPVSPPAPAFAITAHGNPLDGGQSTNDTTPTLTGTGRPGSTVTVYDNGRPIGSTVADANGNWSFTPGAPLADGDHELTAVATDSTGSSNPSTPYSIEIDTVAPSAPVIATVVDDAGAVTGLVTVGRATDDTTPVLSGTAEAGTQVSIFDGDRLWGSATTDANGQWTFTPPSALSEGAHPLTAVATDSAGNASGPSASFELTVDTTAPTTSVSVADPEGDNIPTVSGTASEPGSTVTVTWPDGSTAQAPTDPTTGAWTATAAAPQPSGRVSAVATDAAGNAGPGASTPWTSTQTDTTPPDTGAAGTTVTVGAIAGDGVVNSAEAASNVAVSVTLFNVPADAATTTVTVFVDGVPYAATDSGGGTWTAPVPGAALAAAAPSAVTAEATFLDAAGNTSAPVSGSQAYSVDTTAPTTSVSVADPEGDNIPTVSGTASEPGATVAVTWPDGSTARVSSDPTTGAWTATAAAVQPSGPVSATATDAAGNTGPVTSTPWTSTQTDTTPPDTGAAGTTVTVGTIAGDGVINSAEATGNVAVTVTLANVPADAATTSVTVLVDGVPYGATQSGGGTWTAQVPGAALAAAATPTVTAQVTFSDAAGNTSAPISDSQGYSVDTTAPTTSVAVSDPEGDNIPTVSGTASEPGATITVTWPDGSTAGVSSDPTTGAWSATAAAAQPTGPVSAAATDAAGNAGPGASTPWTSTQTDTTPPDTGAAGTTITVGAIAGDGVINSAEATGNVAVTVTLANVPIDAATTSVTVLVDGVPYAAADGGGGIWTAQVPGAALASATLPTVTAEATFSDAAGNTSAPISDSQGYSVDTTAPTTSLSVADPEGDDIPSVSGTASEPGATVIVTWPDGSSAQVPTDPATGTWTATAAAPQPSGPVSAAATDAAGNAGPEASTPWTSADITPPDTDAAGTTITVGAIAGDGVINSAEAMGNVPVTVTLANVPADAASSAVTVVVDGVRYAATDSGGGTWTAQVPGATLAAAATPTVTAEATFSDAAGNTSAPISDSQSYAVDTTAPTTSVAVADPDGDNIPTVSGTASEPGATVTVSWPDGSTAQVPTDPTTGAWTATAAASQPSGPVSAAATDAAGNAGPGASTPWISTEADTTPPDTGAAGTTITVGTIAGDGVINSAEATGNVAVAVTLANVPADATATIVTVLVDGVPYAAADSGGGTWTAQVPGAALAAAATPTVTAEARFSDAAGNTSAPIADSQNYAVDTTAPTTSLSVSDPEGDNIPTVSGTASEPGSTVTVTWPDGSTSQVPTDSMTGAWTATAAAAQPSGPVNAAATDAAGNAGPDASTPWNSADITPPDTDAAGTTITVGVIASDGVINSTEAAANVAVTVTLTNVPADAASSTVTVVVDGVRYAATDGGGGTWTAQVPGATLAAAATPSVTAEATFSDAAGNTSAPISNSQGYSVDTTAPTTSVSVSDPEGDNIPTVSGTASEPGSTVTVTWPDGSTAQVPTDSATGAWTATAGTPQPSGPVSAAATDAAGNAGPEANTPWTSADITPPDTGAAGTTITVGAITSDGVINGAEAASNVPVTVTLANVPADTATTAVTVLVDGVPYGATSNGDGTWTAQLPGAALAAAATPSVTAEATFSDAAGNTSAPISASQGYAVDTTAPTTSVALALDTGTSGDGITSEGAINVGGLEALATWEYSADGGGTWTPGAGTSFVLGDGTYLDGDIVVRQTDSAGNTSEISLAGTVTVRGLLAVNDAADVDLGSKVSQQQPPITDESLVVIGLLDDGATTNGVPITVAAGSTGDVVIQVSQDALLSVADAFNIEIYDATGTRIYVATAGNNPLVGDALGLDILGVTGDGTVTASVTGLAPGNYTLVVRKGDSALGTLLDADGNGVSLEELGEGGIVLGAANQALVLAAVETSLNGSPGAGLGTVVRGVLEGVLGLTTEMGAGELVDVLTSTLDTLGLSSSLDAVLAAVADALLNNTLSLIQTTSVTVSVTEHGFANAGDPTQGNVLDPNAPTQGEAGEDSFVPGTVVTVVQNSSGVSVPAGQSIAGLYGTLVIAADGAYTYVPNGNPASVGQTETFTYTISDGTNDAQADLVFAIEGSRVTNDTAQAGIEYENSVTAGPVVTDALTYGWVLGIGGIVLPTLGSSLTGDTFLVEADTTQDVTLHVDVSGLVGLGVGGTLFVEERNGSVWTPVNTYDIGQLVDLLDLGGPTRLVASGLDEGEYRTRIALTIPVGVAGSVSVDTESQVFQIGQYQVSQVFAAEGNLLENDLLVSGSALRISESGTYVDVVAGTPETVTGTHGTLTLSADGSFTYEPFTTGSHLTAPVIDVFDYQLLTPDGQVDQGQLQVTIEPSGAGVDAAAPALPMMSFLADEDGVLLGTAFDDILIGRAGDDTLTGHGGRDTFRWDDLDAHDDAGGNGVDTLTDFTIGILDADSEADVIDLSQLLGSPTEDIGNYVNVTQANGGTVLSIDRDGLGTGYSFAPIVILAGDSTDLQQLLAHQQLIV